MTTTMTTATVRRPWLGIIADDFTGAADAASHVAAAGHDVVLYFDVPAGTHPDIDTDCLVVALKSRSVPPEDAVAASVRAWEWLGAAGADRWYLKYCSTFDSTPRGNIGPVLDALADRTGSGRVLVAPSAPRNGRTVFRSHLFVGDRLLAESPMRDHPLNPMRESDVRVLLGQQTARPVATLPWEDVQRLPDDDAALPQGYVVADAITEADLLKLGEVALRDRLSSGSAGLVAGMATAARTRGAGQAPADVAVPSGPMAILCGSASSMTQRQVARFRSANPSFFLDPLELAADDGVADRIADRALAVLPQRVPLVYSTAEPEQIDEIHHALGAERAAGLIEDAMGRIAVALVSAGVRRLVLAGGETSGAAVRALGVRGVRIGPEIDPGVPWTVALDDPGLALVLKSGNFGSERLFVELAES